MNSLMHIAPQLPPAIDGVGDYCWNLWRHWPEVKPDWTFLVARGAKATSTAWPEVGVREFTSTKCSLAESLEQSSGEIAVLHYVGYGFQPKGIPLELPAEIARWKRADPCRRLVTMFHEMYARSSPLRSPFWVAPFARRIIRQLVCLSDAWVTSCDRYFDQLTADFGASPERGGVIPIGSNIPCVSSTSARWLVDSGTPRKLRIVVFGLARTRLWALERHWKLLRALNAAGLLESVTLIGTHEGISETRERESFNRAIGPGLKWNSFFDLSKSEVSQHLVEHDFGLLANEPDIVTKSGVFAALAEHGVIPIISTPEGQPVSAWLAPAVVKNSERTGDFAATLALLGDTSRLQQIRNGLREFATNELTWPRITESWTEVLERFAFVRSALAPQLELQPATEV